MINQSALDLIIKQCHKFKRGSRTKLYVLLFVPILILSWLNFVSYDKFSFNQLLINTVKGLLIMYGLGGIAVVFMIQAVKGGTAKIVEQIIDGIGRNEWRLYTLEKKLVIVKQHSSLFKNPVTVYLMGKVFMKNGHREEGETLINMAKTKKPEVINEDFERAVKIMDKEYIRDVFHREYNVGIRKAVAGIWKHKSFRVAIITFGILVILFWYLVEIAGIYYKK